MDEERLSKRERDRAKRATQTKEEREDRLIELEDPVIEKPHLLRLAPQ